jgi:hypothetical protein
MPRLSWRKAAAGLVLALGCARTPALVPQAGTLPQDPGAARVTLRGVQLEVDAAAWAGEPPQLDTLLPLQVRVTNGSRVALRVDLERLALVGEGGQRLVARPPTSLEGFAWVETPLREPGGVPEQLEGHGGAGFQLPALEPDTLAARRRHPAGPGPAGRRPAGVGQRLAA